MKLVFKKKAADTLPKARRNCAGIIALRQRSAANAVLRDIATKSDDIEMRLQSAREARAYQVSCEIPVL